MPSLVDIVKRAKQELTALSGLEPDAVIRCEPAGDGWTIHMDMVEKRVIPPTNDLIATYTASIGADGSVLRYERARRYIRGNDPEGA